MLVFQHLQGKDEQTLLNRTGEGKSVGNKEMVTKAQVLISAAATVFGYQLQSRKKKIVVKISKTSHLFCWNTSQRYSNSAGSYLATLATNLVAASLFS